MSTLLIIPAELHLVFAYLKARKHVKKSVVVMYVGDFCAKRYVRREWLNPNFPLVRPSVR